MVHSMFYVSNLKKCLSDDPLAILLDEIHIDDKLHFVKKQVEIMDREVLSSSTVTYTSIFTDFEPWRFQWVSDDKLEALDAAPQSPRQAPPSPDYVPGPEHPPLPNYVPGPEEPEQASLSPDYVPESLMALSPGYVADLDSEEDPEEDLVEYLADGRDDADDESSDDDDDKKEEEEEKQEDSEDDDKEEEEHLALADSS
nr:putative reverse transcriptase domain-containing protein [Tanacetum cinerariifolium]